MNRPSAEIAGVRLCWVPCAPPESTLIRTVTCARLVPVASRISATKTTLRRCLAVYIATFMGKSAGGRRPSTAQHSRVVPPNRQDRFLADPVHATPQFSREPVDERPPDAGFDPRSGGPAEMNPIPGELLRVPLGREVGIRVLADRLDVEGQGLAHVADPPSGLAHARAQIGLVEVRPQAL